MHSKIRPFALLLILWTIPAAAQPTSSSSSDYSVHFDPDKVLCVPTQMYFALERVSDTFWLTVRNNPQGVFLAKDDENQLYLLEQMSQRKLLHIEVAGTFIEILAAAKDDDGLRIEATFKSASGANPHQVALRLSPAADGWQAQAIVDAPAITPVTDPPLAKPGQTPSVGSKTAKPTQWVRAFSARSADDFTRGSVFKDRAIPSNVDFTTHRVAATRVMLTSGSNRIAQIQVHETPNAYYVSYTIKRPGIGNTSIRWTTPYAVLPANGKKVFFAERGMRGVKEVPGTAVATSAGILQKKKNPV